MRVSSGSHPGILERSKNAIIVCSTISLATHSQSLRTILATTPPVIKIRDILRIKMISLYINNTTFQFMNFRRRVRIRMFPVSCFSRFSSLFRFSTDIQTVMDNRLIFILSDKMDISFSSGNNYLLPIRPVFRKNQPKDPARLCGASINSI